MKYIKNYYIKIKNKLKNKQWYHQRFDGCPAFIIYIAYAELKQEKRKEPYGNHTLRVCFFEQPRADWYIYLEDIKKTTNEFLEQSRNKRHISKELIKQWENHQKQFYRKCLENTNINIKKLTNDELIKKYNELNKCYISKVTSSAIIDGFALGSDEIIAMKILELLKQKNLEQKFTEYFSKLTAPTRLSFINEAEISLYHIALQVNNFTFLKKLFLKNNSLKIVSILENPQKYNFKNENLISSIKKINKVLIEHQKNYFWSKNNYFHNNVLTKKHFISEIKEIIQENIDIEKLIEKIKNTPINNKKIKNHLFKKLNINPQLKELIQISDDFTWWQDERKKSTCLATHYFSVLIEEIGKRVGLSLLEIKYLSPEEIKHIFNVKIDKKQLRERIKKCAFVYDTNGHECIVGDEVEILRQIILGKQDFSHITELRGLCASVGNATGRVVKVRSATEIHKVKKGDILVAVMTRPDYVVGMKKAAAIVTNEGGITSHAAIVSRELGIPCVIGTKIAMNVLKDGQQVEVDADNGIVRIL